MAKTYRVAVIGHTGRGNYGHGIDEVWLHTPNVEIVGVADADKGGLATESRKLGNVPAYLDYREMIDREKPDLVAIGTRWIDQHRDMAIAAIESGAHVYMEKPFCRTLAEADEIVAACERTHAKLAIAHITRYSPMIDAVRSLIDDGRIGEVVEFRGQGKSDHRGGGEDLWVLGSHIMDLIRCLGGDARWCCASVSNDGHAVAKSDVVEGNEGIGPLAGDTVAAMFGLDNVATGYFGSRRRGAGKTSRFGMQILGTAGVIEITTGYLPAVHYLDDPGWSPGRSGAKWQAVSSAGIGKDEPLRGVPSHEGNRAAVEDLIAAIEEDRQPKSSVYDARAATEMIVAVFESARRRERVELPLETRVNPLTLL